MIEQDLYLSPSPRPGREPAVDLHLLVKNGAAVVGRLLDCVGPHVESVVAVLDDCSDGTADALLEGADRHGIACHLVRISPRDFPGFYLVDELGAYVEGQALVGEDVAELLGSHTGHPMLADFAAARNLGWYLGEGRWRLVLDADDVVDDPDSILPLCAALDEQGVEAVATRGFRGLDGPGVVRERLARRLLAVRWEGACHEHLVGMTPGRAACVDGSLVVRDMMDGGAGSTRISNRNLKIMYREARRRGWRVPPRDLIVLAAEIRGRCPALVRRLCELGYESDSQVERSWAMSLLGMVEEDAGNHGEAVDWYRQSLAMFPGQQPALCMCRANYERGWWGHAVAAWERAVALREAPAFFDLGAREGSVGAMVVEALAKLGLLERARELVRELVSRHGGIAALAELCESIEAQVSRPNKPGGIT